MLNYETLLGFIYLFIYIPLDVEFVVCVEKILTIVVFKVLYSGTYSGKKKKKMFSQENNRISDIFKILQLEFFFFLNNDVYRSLIMRFC